jgi:hypothetical protein
VFCAAARAGVAGTGVVFCPAAVAVKIRTATPANLNRIFIEAPALSLFDFIWFRNFELR